MTRKQRLVVIGNGMAGARFVEDVLTRRGDRLFDIVVFGDEPHGNYNRIRLSGVLAGTDDIGDIFYHPLAWYQENGVKLHAGVRAGWIDRVCKVVHAPGGIAEPYDKLVIATGSTPFLPPMDGVTDDAGALKAGVFVFRTLDDCEAMIQYATHARKVAVIGGGLLGLEAAWGLRNRGAAVHVVHVGPHLMDRQLDTSAGALLKQALENVGVSTHLETRTTAVLGDKRVTGLAFTDGSTLDCDMVVIAAGIRLNVDLAKHAGLLVNRGIVIHDDLSTQNDPDVYAIGECAQHRGQTYGLVAPLWQQASVLADRLTGRNPKAIYRRSKVSTTLKVMGVDLLVVGDKEPEREEDEVVTFIEPSRGVYKKLVVRDGTLAGAIVLGDSRVAPRLLQIFERGEILPENRADLLFPPAQTSETPEVAALPDSAQICNCNGVSKGEIVAAVKAGHCSLKGVCTATRAGTGCGSCKPQIQTLLSLVAGGLDVDDPAAHYYVPGVALTKPELMKAIKAQGLRSVSAVFNSLADGKEDPGSKPGLASLLKTIWGQEFEDERDARFINDRVHANIQKDGTFSVIPRIYGGVVTPQQLRLIADVAEKYHVPMIKITGGQRIDLLGIPKEQLPAVWEDLGMPSGHAYTKAFRTCKTCVGSEFCRFGVGDSTTLGIRIEKRFQGIETPHKLKLATAGCPRNCSEATTKDLGAIAIEGGKWEIYVGGGAGSRVRKGDVLCIVDTHDEVVAYMGRFMQYYREHGNYQERTPAFVERIGIEQLRRVLVDDAEGICRQLDQDIQAAVDAYVDPWKEGSAPAEPAQFAGALAPLGQVEIPAEPKR